MSHITSFCWQMSSLSYIVISFAFCQMKTWNYFFRRLFRQHSAAIYFAHICFFFGICIRILYAEHLIFFSLRRNNVKGTCPKTPSRATWPSLMRWKKSPVAVEARLLTDRWWSAVLFRSIHVLKDYRFNTIVTTTLVKYRKGKNTIIVLSHPKFHASLTHPGVPIPIYRWRQMRHGQFWGESIKSLILSFNIQVLTLCTNLII